MVPFKPFVFIQVHLTNSPHRQVFVVVVFKILEHCPQVQGSVVIKTVNENLLLPSSPSVPSICRKVYQKKLSGRRLRLISDSHYFLLEYLSSLQLKTGFTAYPSTQGSFLPLLRRSTNEPERQKTYFHRVQGLCNEL